MDNNEFIRLALQEDVGPGDFSTLACIPQHVTGKATLKIKEAGVLAGMELAKDIFRFLEAGIVFAAHKEDGDNVLSGETAFDVSAKVHTILTAERLVLNCMQRMSGIATLTQQYCKAVEGTGTKILDTRKTTPLFRRFEKEAVHIGGGHNHRMGLYDMVMLKDNHIDYCGGIAQAITTTYAYLQAHRPDLKIEVETRNLEDVATVLATGHVDRIMLDNFPPEAIGEAVRLIDGRIEIEVSGGVTLENIREYARPGVDYISVGALTHHAVSLDLSLKAII